MRSERSGAKVVVGVIVLFSVLLLFSIVFAVILGNGAKPLSWSNYQSKVESKVQFSKIGKLFSCEASCYCGSERRIASVANPLSKGVVVAVTAASLVFAYNYAGKLLEEQCLDHFGSFDCEEGDISVDNLFCKADIPDIEDYMDESLKSHDGQYQETGERHLCSGYCQENFAIHQDQEFYQQAIQKYGLCEGITLEREIVPVNNLPPESSFMIKDLHPYCTDKTRMDMPENYRKKVQNMQNMIKERGGGQVNPQTQEYFDILLNHGLPCCIGVIPVVESAQGAGFSTQPQAGSMGFNLQDTSHIKCRPVKAASPTD